MERRSYLQDTKSERKAWYKALDKTTKLNTMADYALIRSRDDGVANCITAMTEDIVRYNASADDYDHILKVLVDTAYKLMDDRDETGSGE